VSNEIIFTTIKSNNQSAILEQDDKGYYRIRVGGFNVFNSGGAYYSIAGVKELIENKSSSLNRRLKAGYLKSEAGHPVYQPGMSKPDFYARNMKIEITKVACHIRDIILIPTSEKSGVGSDEIYHVDLWIKPSGPYGDALKAALDNPDENVAFSIRSFTQDKIINGIQVKKILQIITWDWVTEPGVNKASKWGKLAIESLDVCSVDVESLGTPTEIDECFNCSLESDDQRTIVKEILESASSDAVIEDVITDW